MRRCEYTACYFNRRPPDLLLRSPRTRFIQVHQSTRNPAYIVHIMLRGDPAGCCRGGRGPSRTPLVLRSAEAPSAHVFRDRPVPSLKISGPVCWLLVRVVFLCVRDSRHGGERGGRRAGARAGRGALWVWP